MRNAVVGIALVVVAALGAFVVVQLGRPLLPGAASPAASSPVPSGSDELVLRLLAPNYPGPDGVVAPASVSLYPGALPTGIALDLGAPSGARLVGSALRSRSGTPFNVEVVLDVPGAPVAAAEAVAADLARRGWTSPQSSGPPQGGFVQSGMLTTKLLCKGTAYPYLSLVAGASNAGVTDVRLNVQLANPSPGNTYTPCSAEAAKAQGPRQMPNRLPAVRPPEGVRLTSGGSSSSSDWQSSEAGALTTLHAGDLAGAFGDQLAAAGWTRQANGGDGPIAWSTWAVPGEGSWTGVLIVMETTPEGRLLILRAGTSNSVLSSGGAQYGGSWTSATIR